MKSNLLVFVCLVISLIPALAGAADFRPLVGIPGIPDSGLADQNFGDYINALYRLSISIAALLAVIKIVVAGAKYMLDDIVTHKEEAKNDIRGAILGLLVIIGAVIILNTVNTDITKNTLAINTLTINSSSTFERELQNMRSRLKSGEAALCAQVNIAAGEECRVEWCGARDCANWCSEKKGVYTPGYLLGYALGVTNYQDKCTYIYTLDSTEIVEVPGGGGDPNTVEGLEQLNRACAELGAGWTYNKTINKCESSKAGVEELPYSVTNGSLDPNNPDDYLYISMECQATYGNFARGTVYEFNPTLKKCVEKR